MTIELKTDEALKIHIEGLQSTLGKRNERIKALEEALAQPVDFDVKTAKAIKKAYKDGWKDCANKLIDSTQEAARNLGKIRSEALTVYYEGEIK